MKTSKMLAILVLALSLMVCSANIAKAAPIGTAFTYQGFLKEFDKQGKPRPADGQYDFNFSLYDDPNIDNQVGDTININDLEVIDGYFVVELDFGGNIFTGDRRWLEMAVRDGSSNDPCDFVTLSPRLEVTLTPYAIYAKTTGSITNGSGMQDAIVRGFELTYNSDANMYVEPGTLFHGPTGIKKVARTILTLAEPNDWWDNTVDSYFSDPNWCYIGVNNSGDIKFLGNNPPDKADTSGNSEGIKLYWYDSASYWRVIGAIRVNTSDQVARRWFQQGSIVMWDVPVCLTTTLSTNSWTAGDNPLDCNNLGGIPAISTVGIFGIDARDDNVPISVSCVSIRPNGSNWTNERGGGLGALQQGTGQRWCATDSSQRIQYRNDVYDNAVMISAEGYVLNIR